MSGSTLMAPTLETIPGTPASGGRGPTPGAAEEGGGAPQQATAGATPFSFPPRAPSLPSGGTLASMPSMDLPFSPMSNSQAMPSRPSDPDLSSSPLAAAATPPPAAAAYPTTSPTPSPQPSPSDPLAALMAAPPAQSTAGASVPAPFPAYDGQGLEKRVSSSLAALMAEPEPVISAAKRESILGDNLSKEAKPIAAMLENFAAAPDAVPRTPAGRLSGGDGMMAPPPPPSFGNAPGGFTPTRTPNGRAALPSNLSPTNLAGRIDPGNLAPGVVLPPGVAHVPVMLPGLDPSVQRYPVEDPLHHTTPAHPRRAFRSPKPPTKGRLHDSVFSGGRLARDGKRPPRVKLYRNGDKFFEGKSVLLNEPAHDLDHWLEKITPRMGHGALRRIYTHDGRRIRQLNQLVDGASYVVARQERYKKVKYTGIVDVRTRELQYRQKRVMILKKRPQPHTIHGLSGKLGDFDVKGRIRDVLKQTKPKTIYLIRNGDDRNVCVPMLLTQRNARDFNQVCQRISNRLQLEAPCRAIYNISGASINEIAELQHGITYVAVGRIAFNQVGYKPAPPPKKLGRKQGKKGGALGVHGQGKGGNGDLKSMIQKKLKVAEIVGRLGRTDTREQEGQDPSQKMTNAEAAAGGKIGRNRKITPYTVSIFTGKEKNMGTTAHVFITVYGELGDSGRLDLWEDERNFKAKEAADEFVIEVPRIGEIERIVLEHDGTGETDEDNEWFCEHVEVRDDASGPTGAGTDSGGGIKKYFWLNQWLKMPPPYIGDEPEGGWPARVAKAEVNGTLCMDAESAAAEAKALASGMSLGQMKQQSQAFTALEARLLTICKDKQQTKRLWRQLAAESGSSSSVPLHAFWELCSDNFPILNNMSSRMRAFNRTIFKANIDGDNKVGKHTFRLLLLNTLYFCRVYSVFDTDEDGSSDADMGVEIVKEKLPFLGISMDDAEVAIEYDVMKNTSGGLNDADTGDDVSLDDFCVWYSSRRVPKDVKEEAANAEDKQKKKEEKKQKKRLKKKEKAAAEAALAEVVKNSDLKPGERSVDTSGDGIKDTMVLVDTDNDGIANIVMMDTDGDGTLETVMAIPGQIQIGPTDAQKAAQPATLPPYDPNDRVEKAAWEAGEKVSEFEKASVMEKARQEMRAVIAKEEAEEKSKQAAIKASLMTTDEAATKIQAGFRGMKGRRRAKGLRAGTDGSKLQATQLKGFRDKLGSIRTLHPGNMAGKHFNDAAYVATKDPAVQKEMEACVMPAIDHPEAALGVFALTSEDYDRFTETFDPLVRDVHGVAADVTHTSNLEIKSDTLDLSSVQLNIVSVGIEARRNVKGLPLSGGMSINDRLALEMKLIPAFEMFKDLPDFGGRYYSMTAENPDYIDDAAWENMRTADGERAMPKDLSSDAVLVSAGIATDYPKGRGCYMSDDGETIIWVGGEDHLRIACVKEGKTNAFNDVLDNLRMILDIFASSGDDLTFAKSEKYGFITSSPQYVGTAMRAFANVQVPHLIAEGLEPAAKIVEPLGLKVSKKDAGNDKSVANREPAEGRCQVSVNAKFGVSEADEANKLLAGLNALADSEQKLAVDKGVPHVMVSTDASDALSKDLAAAAAADNAGEKAPEDAADDTKDHISIPEKRRDSAPLNVSVPISWDQLEENIKKLPDNPDMLTSMWEHMDIADAPATVEQFVGLLEEIDLRLGASKEPLHRAFSSIIDHEATTITIQKAELYSLIAGSFYFAKLFTEFPDAETDRDKKLDLKAFQDAVGKLKFEEPPTDLSLKFDAMESNDGGLISFDDFVVWYISSACPRAVSGMGAI